MVYSLAVPFQSVKAVLMAFVPVVWMAWQKAVSVVSEKGWPPPLLAWFVLMAVCLVPALFVEAYWVADNLGRCTTLA